MNIFKNNKEKEEINIPKNYKSVINFFLELIKIVIVSLAIIIPIRAYVAQPFYVEGASMEPNFYDKEYLIIDEISYRFTEPERGDVVIFKPPTNNKSYYIKRIIGLPNETVEIKNNNIWIYNEQSPEGFILDESHYLEGQQFTTSEDVKFDPLEDNEYFVLGDNRHNSMDSRRLGPINIYSIKGQVFIRAFPFNRFTVFTSLDYYN